ncbi:MAG: hypothetical protein ACK5QT_11435 [Oligoflexia bacterium]
MHRLIRGLGFVLSVWFSLGGPSAEAAIGEQFGFDPFLEFKTLETPHFRISHASEHDELARLAARHLEEAHRVLSPLMRWEPRFKTQVVLVDTSDFANGLAGAVGRLGMVLWTTPPDNWMSIAHYDDWFRMLCFHEYAHILNMDITDGLYSGLRWLFGETFLPNALWQRWMLEGLAVSHETTYTRAGRGRSSYYGMLRRGVWRAGMLEDVESGGRGIGQITGPRTIPPGGEVPYFFGHELMNELAQGKPEVLGDLSRIGASSFPYMYNTYARSASSGVVKQDWLDAWKSWSSKARERAKQEAALVEAAGRTDPEYLSNGNYLSYRPALSSDGRWVAYGRELYNEQPVLALRDLQARDPQKAERRLIENIGGGSVAFLPDSSAVVFSTVEREGLFRFFSQLWVHEIQSGRSYALDLPAGEVSLRAKDPDIQQTPEGLQIVFTFSTPGRVGVARGWLARKQNGKLALTRVERLYEPPLLGRASTPRISADGRRIVFSLHENGQIEERLVVLEQNQAAPDHATRWAVRELFSSPAPGALERFPAWLNDTEIVFSSNRTGIDNLYRVKVGRAPVDHRSAQAITNVETGAWFAAPAPDGKILATVYTPTGWELARFTPQGSNPPRMIPPRINNEPHFKPSGAVPTVAPPVQPQEESQWQSSRYSVYPSILPRYWNPVVFSSASGGTLLGAQVLGFDALDIHRYQLGLNYDTGLSAPGGFALYSNRSLGVVWSLGAASELRGIGWSSFQREESLSATVSLLRPFTEAFFNPSLQWVWERESNFSIQSGELILRRAPGPRLRALVSFTDTDTSRQSVLTEEGWSGLLGHQWSLNGDSQVGQELLWEQGHYFHLGGHAVLWPHWQVALSDKNSVQLEGRRNQLVDSFGGSNFDQVVVRGYPRQVYTSLKHAAVGSLDFRFPIRRFEQGWRTYPVFFEVLQGLAFAETAAFTTPSGGMSRLGSWGAGIRGDWVLFNALPVVTALEFHQGLNDALGGRSELFFEFRLGGMSF